MATADGKMNFNFVTGHHNYYSPSLRFADAFAHLDLVDVDFLQTTLTADHAAGTAVFQVANNRFPEGRCKFRNASSGPMTVRLHDPDNGALVPVQVFKVLGSPILRATGAFSNNRTFPAGTIVDAVTGIDGWRNNSPIAANLPMTPYVVDGRNTGMPQGLKLDQSMRSLMGIPYARFPAGDWTFLGKGTGTYRFELDLRDRPNTVTVEVSIDHGVPQGSPLVNFPSSEVQQIYATLIASDPSDPLYDPHLVPPGTWGNDGSPWAGLTYVQIWQLPENASNPKFMCPYFPHIARRRLARRARLVDEQRTIMVGDWSGMETLADMPPDTPRFGCGEVVPFGWLIRECNLAKNDPWLNVAVSWKPEILDAMLDQWIEEGDEDLDPGIADDCECWNYGFGAYTAMSVLGSARFSPRTCQSLTYLTSGPNAGKVRAQKTQHGFSTGQTVQISGGGIPAYNGAYAITADDADHFFYTPAVVPSASPCPDSWSGPPLAFPVADSLAFSVSGLKWYFDQYDSYLELTTTAPHGCDQNTVVQLCNVAKPGIDGAYRVTVQSSTVLRLYFGSQQLYMPQLTEAATSPETLGAASGQAIRIAHLGASGPAAGQTVASGNGFNGAVAMLHGWREAQHAKQAQAKFPDEPGRYFLVNEIFAAGTGYGATTLDSYIAAMGGVLPPVTDHIAAIATYVDPLTFDQRANYVGDCKPIASATVSGGVCTATIDTYPVNPYDGNGVTSTGFGGSAGESIYLYNVRDVPDPGDPNNRAADHKVSGRFGPVTIVNASKISFPTPGVPDGPLTGIRLNPFLIRGTPKAYEITGYTRSGTSITCTSKGHGLQVGSQVYFAGWFGATYEQKCTVTAVTADTFTVTVPGASFDPQFSYTGRAYAFDPAATLLAAPARLSRVSDPGWVGWLVDNAALAKSRGHRPATYETGYQDQPESYLSYVPWLDPLMTINEADPVNGQVVLASVDAHIAAGIEEYNYYTMVPWGHFGLSRYIDLESPVSIAYASARATYGRNRKSYGTATHFTIVAPTAAAVGEASNWGQVVPSGKVPFDVTVTLDDDGRGGTFSPATLTFRQGSRSPQGFRYTAVASGRNPLRATTTPQLGEMAMGGSITLDAYGNPGNATIVFSDDMNRADGLAGSKWTSLPPDNVRVAGNNLTLDIPYPRAIAFAAMDPVLHAQVEATFNPAPDGTPYNFALSMRADPATGRAYIVSFNGSDAYLRFYYRQSRGNEVYLGAIHFDNPVSATTPHTVVCKVFDTPGRLVGWIVDDSTGSTVGTWDYQIPPVSGDGNNTPITPITTPGVVGFGGDQPSPLIDNVTIWRLDFATSFQITPSSGTGLAGEESDSFVIEPVGGPILRDTIFALDDNNQSGTFSPLNPTLTAGDYNTPATFTYTPTGATGARNLRATGNPALGDPATATYTVIADNTPPPIGLATGVAIYVSAATTVGQASQVVAVLTGTSGATGLGADLVLTLSTTGGSFGGTVTIPSGQWSGTTTFTANTAGAKTINGSIAGGNGNMTVSPATTTATVAVSSTPTVPTADQLKAACVAALQETPVALIQAYDKSKNAASASDVATAANNAVANLAESIVIPATANGGLNGAATAAVKFKTFVRYALASILGNVPARTDPTASGTVKDPVSGLDLYTVQPLANGGRTVSGTNLGA